MEGWREGGREGGGLTQRRCPVLDSTTNTGSDWEKQLLTGTEPSSSTCSSSSVSVSISARSASSPAQPPAIQHVSVRLRDTRGRTLRWVVVLHGPALCFAVYSSPLFGRYGTRGNLTCIKQGGWLKLPGVCAHTDSQANFRVQMSTAWTNNGSFDPVDQCVSRCDGQMFTHSCTHGSPSFQGWEESVTGCYREKDEEEEDEEGRGSFLFAIVVATDTVIV